MVVVINMPQSSSDSTSNDPVYRYAQTELIDTLVNDHEIFSSYKDAIIFLGVLGYREGESVRKGLSGFNGDVGEIDYSTFATTSMYIDILGSLAFQHTGDPDMLVDREEQLEILDMYAAGGLQIFQREFGQVKGDPTDAIVNFIQTYEDKDEPAEGELQTILDAFNQDSRLG
jgi:dnd system-associated protein 4